MHWLPGWVERGRDEGCAELAQVLAGERWIIDGNYGSILPMKLERADTVIWLNYPTSLCLKRVITRWWHHRGRTRPDMTEGRPERLSRELFHYVLTFRKAWNARNAVALERFGGEVVRLATPAQTEAWLVRRS